MAWKSDEVFLQMKACPLMYTCIMFRCFDKMSQKSADIILRFLEEPLAIL